nr:hypothetical protein WS70_27130 [Burkholderia mayonis]
MTNTIFPAVNCKSIGPIDTGCSFASTGEVDPQKRTPILVGEEVPSWASIGKRTRRSSGRRWWSE